MSIPLRTADQTVINQANATVSSGQITPSLINGDNLPYFIAATPDTTTYNNYSESNPTAVIKSSAGRLYFLSVQNLNTSIRYLQLFNRTTVPTGGTAPDRHYPIPGGTANTPGCLLLNLLDFGFTGKYFSSGIVWAFSTTAKTYTAGTASEIILIVDYL